MIEPKAVIGRIEHVKPGQPIKYYRRKNGTAVVFTVCCDCALTHLEEFTPRKNYIRVRVWRDDEKTKKFRKRKNK
jgi:hypothetical protein